MRTRPYLNASESPRPYGDVLSERAHQDPRRGVLGEIAELEAQACDAIDPAERKRLQCEAEALRCALAEQPMR